MSHQEKLLSRLNEYQLMVEEILGGMDMMISRLEHRVEALERSAGIVTNSDNTNQNDVHQIKQEMQQLRLDMQRGFSVLLQQKER